MLRRWIIRSLFLLPLVCVIALWVTSYVGALDLRSGAWGRNWECCVFRGLMYNSEHPYWDYLSPPLKFQFLRDSRATDFYGGPMLWGFYGGRFGTIRKWYAMVFPLWLPTLLLLGLNWFVWRKTRQRAGRGAFPVETSAASKA